MVLSLYFRLGEQWPMFAPGLIIIAEAGINQLCNKKTKQKKPSKKNHLDI